MLVRYEPDHAAIGRYLRNDLELYAVLASVAEKVAETARSEANLYRDSGAFHDSIHVEREEKGGVKGDRQEARVVADSPDAVYEEFGTSHRAGHHELATALDGARV